MASPSTPSTSSSSLSSLSQSAVQHQTIFAPHNAMTQNQSAYNRSFPLTAQPQAVPYTYHTNLTSTFLPAGSAPNAAPIQPYPPNGFQYTHSQLPAHQSSMPMMGKPPVMSGNLIGGGSFDPLMSPDFYSSGVGPNQTFNQNRSTQIHNAHAFHINHHYTHDSNVHKPDSGVLSTAHPSNSGYHVPHPSSLPPNPHVAYHAGVTHDTMHQNVITNNNNIMLPQKSSPSFESLSNVVSVPQSDLPRNANSTVSPNISIQQPIGQTIPHTHTITHSHPHTHLVGGSSGGNGKKGSACLVCYRAKTSCDGERPCFRCVRLHKTHLCYDRPKDERHPRRRKGSSARSRSRRNQLRKSAAAAAANGRASKKSDETTEPGGNQVDGNNEDDDGEDGSDEGEGDEDDEADEDELDHSSTSHPSVDTDRETSPSSSPETVELVKMSKRVNSAVDHNQITITQAQWYVNQVSDFLSGLEFDVLTRDFTFPIFVSHTSASASAFNFNSSNDAVPPPLESPISTTVKSATDADADSSAAAETAAEKSISSSLLALSTASRSSSDAITGERRKLFTAQYDSSPLLCMEEDTVSPLAQQKNQQSSANLSQAASSVGGIVHAPIEDSVPMMIIATVESTVSKTNNESTESKSNTHSTSTETSNPRKRPAATETPVDSKRIKLEGNESAPVKSSFTVEATTAVKNAPPPVRSLCVQVNREWERLFGFTQKEVRQSLLKDGNGFFSRLFRSDAKDHAVKAVLSDDASRTTSSRKTTATGTSAAASNDVDMQASDKSTEPNLKFLAVIVNKWLAEIHCLVQARPHHAISSSNDAVPVSNTRSDSIDSMPGCVLTWQPLPDPRPPKIKTKHKRAKSHS